MNARMMVVQLGARGETSGSPAAASRIASNEDEREVTRERAEAVRRTFKVCVRKPAFKSATARLHEHLDRHGAKWISWEDVGTF